MAAINLVKSGVKIRIFESRSERSPFSKALAIHAGTLELLEETHPDLDASYFRVILIPHIDLKIPKTISIDYFRNLAKIIAPQIELSSENKWLTSFEISKRLASKLCVGRIFLAGDAAHVHSPVGGQGMNLDMQDASIFPTN